VVLLHTRLFLKFVSYIVYGTLLLVNRYSSRATPSRPADSTPVRCKATAHKQAGEICRVTRPAPCLVRSGCTTRCSSTLPRAQVLSIAAAPCHVDVAVGSLPFQTIEDSSQLRQLLEEAGSVVEIRLVLLLQYCCSTAS
jgi:hypothetical protein